MVRIPINGKTYDDECADFEERDDKPDIEEVEAETEERVEQVSDVSEVPEEEETLATSENKYLRLRADFDNYKRNADKERCRLADVGKERLLEDILPVYDHLGRAMQAAGQIEDDGVMLKGLEMVRKQLESAFDKHGIEKIAALGEQFDPEVHEATATVESEEEEGTVIQELRPGFKICGRLLQPALVIVAK